MNKLLPAIIISLFAMSCQNHNSQSEKNEADTIKSKINKALAAPLPPNGITLNGVDAVKATTMMDNFKNQCKNDLNTTKVISVWYSVDEIKAMNNLLAKEYQEYAQDDKPDGVRIYFGCEKLAAGTGTKITPVVFLVSTKTRKPTIDSLSKHEDYYNHLSGILPPRVLGGAPKYNANDALSYGALLYGATMPADTPCTAKPNYHYINGADAYNAAHRHQGGSAQNDYSAYNTRAEWFDLCFINSAFNAITDTNNHLNGLRIYLGKMDTEKDGKNRDVFILVPTHNVNGIPTDTYRCLEGLKSFVCNYNWTDSLKGDKKHNAHMTFMRANGYDKGELCPTNCNL